MVIFIDTDYHLCYVSSSIWSLWTITKIQVWMKYTCILSVFTFIYSPWNVPLSYFFVRSTCGHGVLLLHSLALSIPLSTRSPFTLCNHAFTLCPRFIQHSLFIPPLFIHLHSEHQLQSKWIGLCKSKQGNLIHFTSETLQ